MTATVWTESERRRLVGLCAALTGDRSAAEDLAQETLLEAWRQRHKLRDAGGADRWLSAIARNICLRWASRRGRELPLAASGGAVEELAADVEPSELEELVERTLPLLPPGVRDVLVRHYVDGASHAEIAGRLGLSEGAVSVRVSRGRALFRRLLDADVRPSEAGWRETRIWCTSCGAGRLELRLAADAVTVRCLRCGRRPASVYRLGNPRFAQLLGGLVRPTAILGRAADWSSSYFGGGVGPSVCTRCGGPVPLRRVAGGLGASCAGCGEEVWSSVAGLAVASASARAFRRDHRRVRTLPAVDEQFDGVEATLVELEAVGGTARHRVAFDRHTLRHLGSS